MALADRAELAVRLTLDDRGFTGPLRRVKSNLAGLDKATSNTQRALGKTGASLQRTAVIAAAAATGGFLAAVRAAGDFQDAFQGIVKTVDAPASRLEELRDQIRAMAREMPIAATELAAIGETAGALGIDSDAIDEFIETVAKLGVTTNLTSEEAADALGRISTILGFSATDIQTFASALVALGNQGASTEAEIIEVTKRFAASGEQAGLSTDQILAYSSAISSLGVEPEAAGTALSKAFGRIIQETATASAEGKEFAKVAGVSFKEFSTIVEKDTNRAMLLFLDGLSELDKFGASRALEDLGITGQRERDAILKFAQNTEFLREQLELAGEAIKDTSAIDTEAAKRFDTFNSKLQVAKNVLNDVGITIGDRVLPKIIPFFERFGDFVANNGPAIDKFADQVASAFDEVATAIVNLPWDSIMDGLKMSGQLAKGVIDAFKQLPGPLQAALISGFALNKATGGLITGVGQDVAGAALNKLLTGSIFGRGATPANPLFVMPVGGGIGGLGGAGAGAGGGGLKGVLGLGGGLAGALRAWLPAAVIGGAIATVIGPPIATVVRDLVVQNQRGAIRTNTETGEAIGFTAHRFGDPTKQTTDVGVRDAVIRATTQERADTASTIAKLEQTRLTISSLSTAERTHEAGLARLTTAQTISKLEANRLTIAQKLSETTSAQRGTTAAIQRKNFSPIINTRVTVNTSVTVRDQQLRSRSSSAFGFMIGGK